MATATATITVFCSLLAIFAGMLAIPVIVLFLEVTAAVTLQCHRRSTPTKYNRRPRLGVLVPAHNESAGIVATLEDIKAQLHSDDRLVVVADNCDDDTAAIAASVGAEVVERNDPNQVGKGFALDRGLQELSVGAPEIVIMIDADCRVAKGTLDQLAMACFGSRRPAQALDLMIAPKNSSMNYCVAEFAWLVKNWVRPLGLSKLNLPCQLMGTGMAFQWDTIRAVNLANNSIVEDLKLGLDVALVGRPAHFCPDAIVTSFFSHAPAGMENQRRRWEHGHIAMIVKMLPRYFVLAVYRQNTGLMALALDAMVPPLSLLGLVVVATFAVGTILAFFGFPAIAMIISSGSLVVFITTVCLAWVKWGKDVLPARLLLSIIPYVMGKMWMYFDILTGRRVPRWTRADRTQTKE